MISLDIRVTTTGVLERIDKSIEKLEQELTYRIVDEARTLIDSSVPAGRIYRRGSFGRGASRGLGAKARGKGSRFHRASAPGQPPAEDTGKTYRDISVRRMRKGYYRVRFGGAAGYLEFGTSRMKPRPYILKAVEIAAEKTFR